MTKYYHYSQAFPLSQVTKTRQGRIINKTCCWWFLYMEAHVHLDENMERRHEIREMLGYRGRAKKLRGQADVAEKGRCPRAILRRNRKFFESKLRVKEILPHLQQNGVITKSRLTAIFSGKKKAAMLLDVVLEADESKFQRFLQILQKHQEELYRSVFQQARVIAENRDGNIDKDGYIEMGVHGTILLEEKMFIVAQLKNVQQLTAIMQAHDILNDYEARVINRGDTSALVDIVAARGKDAFEKFVKALTESNNEGIRQKLDTRISALKMEGFDGTKEVGPERDDTRHACSSEICWDLEICKLIMSGNRSTIISRMQDPVKVGDMLNVKGGLKEQIPFSEDNHVLASLIIDTVLASPDYVLKNFLQILSCHEVGLHYYLQRCGARKVTTVGVKQPHRLIRVKTSVNDNIGSTITEPGIEYTRPVMRSLDRASAKESSADLESGNHKAAGAHGITDGSEEKNGRHEATIKSHLKKARIPQPLDVNNLNLPFGIGSKVEVDIPHCNDSGRQCGVIRWIGYWDSPEKPIAGIELEQDNPAGTDGIYMNTRLFQCAPKRAMFMFLHRCKKVEQAEGHTHLGGEHKLQFLATYGSLNRLLETDPDIRSVKAAVRHIFDLPQNTKLYIRYCYQEKGYVDWVQSEQDYFKNFKPLTSHRLTVFTSREDIENQESEIPSHIRKYMSSIVMDFVNSDHIPDEDLF